MDTGEALEDRNNGCVICFGDRKGNLIPPEILNTRYRKWSAAERDSKGVETPDRPGRPEYSDDPLESFMNYLLFETNPKYKNVVYMHNGGKKDDFG